MNLPKAFKTMSPENHFRFRDLYNLTEALKKHAHLLEKYYIEMYENNDKMYLGEIIAKLRLLVCGRSSNTPLLLRLFQVFDFKPTIEINSSPYNIEKWTLERYIKSNAASFAMNGEFKSISIEEYIYLFANKIGSAHEDWILNDEIRSIQFYSTFSGDIIKKIGIDMGMDFHEYQIKISTEIIFQFTHKFLSHINEMDARSFEIKNATYLYKQDPKNLYGRLKYAGALSYFDRKSRATSIMKILDIPPSDIYANFLAIKYYINIGDYNNVCHYCRIVLSDINFMEQLKDAWGVQYNYACALARLGLSDDAIEELSKLERWSPTLRLDMLESDPDLENLRANKESWSAVISKLRSSRNNT